MRGKRVSKEIGQFILNAGQKTDLYCILPKEHTPPVATDIRVMSSLLELSVAKEIPGNKKEGYDPVWVYYLHIKAAPLTEHSLLEVFINREERDKAWEKSVKKWKDDLADMKKRAEMIEKAGGYCERIG